MSEIATGAPSGSIAASTLSLGLVFFAAFGDKSLPVCLKLAAHHSHWRPVARVAATGTKHSGFQQQYMMPPRRHLAGQRSLVRIFLSILCCQAGGVVASGTTGYAFDPLATNRSLH